MFCLAGDVFQYGSVMFIDILYEVIWVKTFLWIYILFLVGKSSGFSSAEDEDARSSSQQPNACVAEVFRSDELNHGLSSDSDPEDDGSAIKAPRNKSRPSSKVSSKRSHQHHPLLGDVGRCWMNIQIQHYTWTVLYSNKINVLHWTVLDHFRQHVCFV